MKHSAKKRIEQEKKAAQRKVTLKWGVVAGIILVIQAVASGFLFLSALNLGMFPLWMLEIAAGVVLVLALISSLLFFGGKKENLGKNFRRFTGIFLAAAITVTSVYVGNLFGSINQTVENITTAPTVSEQAEPVVETMNVYVLSTSTATSLADCKSLKFGVIGGNDGPASFAAVTKIKSELASEINVTDYKNFSVLGIDFYHKDIQVAVINQTYLGTLKESSLFSNWNDQTKLITSIEITESEFAAAEASNPYSKGNYDKPVEIKPATSAVDNIDVEPFIVYISGSDTRDEYFATERSDVNILMVVNPQTKQILLVNTPRDYYVPNPRSSVGTEDKLTHLGLYGVDCSITGLENLYDCDINYYVQINFTGAEKLVDDIGGITFYNPREFSGRGCYFPEGEITINGEEAVVFARERYAFAEGDNMRGQNQMRLITAIFNKVTSSPTLILNYQTILDDLDGYIVTNMESDEIDTLVRMQLNDLAEWNIQTYAVTGWGGMDTTYSAPYEDLYVTYPYMSTVYQGQDLIDRVLDGETLTDEDVE